MVVPSCHSHLRSYVHQGAAAEKGKYVPQEPQRPLHALPEESVQSSDRAPLAPEPIAPRGPRHSKAEEPLSWAPLIGALVVIVVLFAAMAATWLL